MQKPGNMRKCLKIVERAKGFEPFAQNSEVAQNQASPQPAQNDCTQIRAQIPDLSCPELARVVAVWSKLPAPLKAAILAIVNSSIGSKEGER
jgi:hypothetical protein